MAYHTLPEGYFAIPYIGPHAANVGQTISPVVIDAATEKVVSYGIVPKTGTALKYEFYITAVTQLPTCGLKISFQDLSTGQALFPAQPDGTIDQYVVIPSTKVKVGWVVPGSMTNNGTTSGTKRSVTAGQTLCAVVEFNNFNTGDSVSIGYSRPHMGLTMWTQYGVVLNASGAWQLNQQYAECGGLKYTDGTYGNLNMWNVPSNATVSSSVSFLYGTLASNEAGIKFTLTYPVRIVGAWVSIKNMLVTDDFWLKLYNGTTTVACKTFYNADKHLPGTYAFGFFRFSSAYTTQANATYRLVIAPSTGSNGMTMWTWATNTTSLMQAAPFGSSIIYTQRYSQGTTGGWNDQPNRRPCMGLVLGAIDDGVSTGTVGTPRQLTVVTPPRDRGRRFI